MIASLNGKIIDKSGTELILECSGVGYLVSAPTNEIEKMPDIGSSIFLHIHTSVKEDDISLFGFLRKDTRSLFRLLISISGIGPKSALGILSSLEPSEFHRYITQNNILGLTKLPGVGKKTAERLVVELKDKILSYAGEVNAEFDKFDNSANEAIQALMALGYNKNRSELLVKKSQERINSNKVEDLIRESLKIAMSK